MPAMQQTILREGPILSSSERSRSARIRAARFAAFPPLVARLATTGAWGAGGLGKAPLWKGPEPLVPLAQVTAAACDENDTVPARAVSSVTTLTSATMPWSTFFCARSERGADVLRLLHVFAVAAERFGHLVEAGIAEIAADLFLLRIGRPAAVQADHHEHRRPCAAPPCRAPSRSARTSRRRGRR